jgi:preprotein translocase subunit SecE
VLGVVFLFIIGLGILSVTNFGSNAIKLMKESRTEIRRVVWPTRIETTQTFLVVFGIYCCIVFIFLGI